MSKPRGIRETGPSLGGRSVWIVTVVLAVSMVTDIWFNAEESRVLSYLMMCAWIAVAGGYSVLWYLAPRARNRLTAVHYGLLAMAIYMPATAFLRSDADLIESSLEIGKLYLWMTGFFFFYAAARSNAVSEQHVKTLLLITIPFMLLLVVLGQARDQAIRQGDTYASGGGGYACLALLPWALLLKRSSLPKFVAIGLCAIGVIVSLKRGAILAMCVGGAVTFAAHSLFFRRRISFRLSYLVGIGMLASALGVVVYTQREGLTYRMRSDSSGRDVLLMDYWSQLEAASPAEWLLGHGSRVGQRINTARAHNDWLEIWFDYGVIGVVMTGMAFVLLGLGTCSAVLRQEHAASASCFAFTVLVLMSIYSGALALPTFVLYSSAFGMAHAGSGTQATPLSRRAPAT